MTAVKLLDAYIPMESPTSRDRSGFDWDSNLIFEETLNFMEQAVVQNATFNILTPFPGSPYY